MNDRALRLWTLAASFAFTSGISAAATPALACGGGYGQDVALADSQIMALSFRDGVETYVFQPAFCGSSAAFGLVLPVPNVLQSDPSVVDDELFPALFELSKPTVEVVESCEPSRSGGEDGGASPGDNDGAQVLGGGRVDVFEWVLLEASSSSDLTDWLDENDFPYDSYATEAFDSYVEDGFKFVTFRVSPDELDGQDCGTFGPIALSFETDAPIVPLRIATAHEDAAWKSFAWTVYAVSDTQLEAESTDLESNTRFSGAVDDDALNQWPALAEIAEIGDRVTELRVQFEGESLTSDLRLRATATEDFRRTETLIQVTGCDDDGDASSGCAVGSSSSAGRISWLMLGALFLLRARRRAQR